MDNKNPNWFIQLKLANKYLPEILEDIALYGYGHPCALFYSKKNGSFQDYMPLTREKEKIYDDEILKEATLLDALILVIAIERIAIAKNHLTTYTAVIIKTIRILYNVSQKDFADHIGELERTVQRWETGEREITIDKAIDIAKRCGYDKSIISHVMAVGDDIEDVAKS